MTTMSAQFVAFLIFTQATNIHTFYKPTNSSNSQPGRENISLQSRTTPSPSSDIGLVDALFQDCSSLFPSSSLTFPQMMIIAKDTQHQVDEARDRSNVIFDFNVTPLPQTLIATSLSTSQQRLAPSNLSLYATSSTPTPPANDLPLVFTVLILLITALAGLCDSTSKIDLFFTILVLFQITCSAAFIPTQIALGYWHTCALSEDNTVKCWGNNGEGQLGYGDTNPRGDQAGEMGDSLDTIDLGTNFIPTQITAGWDFTCALSQTHTVKCWGHGFYGQLGYGDRDNRGDAPGQMGDLLNTIDLGTNFIPTQIVAGQSHTCALSQSNTMKCWGTNAAGQLGYGDQDGRGWGPGQMGDSLNVIDLGSNFIPTQMAVGYLSTCALSQSHTVKCFGYNPWGQLGYEDINGRGTDPGQMGDDLDTIDLGSNFIPTQIFGGDRHTCALSQTNTVKCWGRNFDGELGYGDQNNRGDDVGQMGDALDTVDLGTMFTPTDMSSGYLHTCAISESDTVKCFGYNEYGQLGYGDSDSRGDNANEMGDFLHTIDLGTGFIPTDIWVGPLHTCALSEDKTVKCFGYNEYGQLGYGDANNRGDDPCEMGDALPTVYLMGTATVNTTNHLCTSAPTYQPTMNPIDAIGTTIDDSSDGMDSVDSISSSDSRDNFAFIFRHSQDSADLTMISDAHYEIEIDLSTTALWIMIGICVLITVLFWAYQCHTQNSKPYNAPNDVEVNN